jgi:hypothetical protein
MSFVMTCAIMGAIIGAMYASKEWKSFLMKRSLNTLAFLMMIFTAIYSGVWFLTAIMGFEEDFFNVLFWWAITFVIYFIASIGYTCPSCDMNSLDIQGDKSGTWTDTTPKTKSGSTDKRFNSSGYTWLTLKCKNDKCGKIFTAPKKHIFHTFGD